MHRVKVPSQLPSAHFEICCDHTSGRKPFSHLRATSANPPLILTSQDPPVPASNMSSICCCVVGHFDAASTHKVPNALSHGASQSSVHVTVPSPAQRQYSHGPASTAVLTQHSFSLRAAPSTSVQVPSPLAAGAIHQSSELHSRIPSLGSSIVYSSPRWLSPVSHFSEHSVFHAFSIRTQ